MTDPSSEIDAVTALVVRYAACIDAGDLDGLADLFTAGVLRSPAGDAHGRDEVRRMYDSVVLDEQGLPGTHHMVFDIEVAIDGTAARGHSYVTVIHERRPIIAGRYDDRFVRDAGGWHFAERVVHLDLVGDISGHYRPARSR
jgi:ketosteroid isomerase-like protein